MSTIRLDGQGMVIAGGPGGVAGAVARLAAERGAAVLLERPDSGTCQVSADAETVDALFDLAAERLPALSAVVVDLTEEPLPPARPVAETTRVEWNAGLELLLRRPFLLAQRAVQDFLAGGDGGRIVLVVPEARLGGACVAAQAAQTALQSFARSVAREYGRREIACNAVVVGDDRPEAVAETVLFFASGEASFVNGETVFAEPAPVPSTGD